MLIQDVNQNLLIDKFLERRAAQELAAAAYACVAEREDVEPELAERFRGIARDRGQLVGELGDVIRRFGREPGTDTMPVTFARREIEGALEVAEIRDAGRVDVLQALLAFELIDQVGWEVLEELGKRAGIDEDILRQLRAANRQVKERVHVLRTHLERVAQDLLALRP